MAQELQRRLQQGESETLEFKRSLGELREIVETVGAFANARGGTLREAVVNAVCHRDYASSGEVQVRLFDDRLEVWNPGTLPEGLSPEDLRRAHDSRPRNKLLAQAFFLLKYIEQWGTGTLRMIGTCRDAGFPEPEFTERATRFVVTFHKSKLTREYLERLGLSERQLVAVEYVKSKGRITNREYVQLVGVSPRTATRDLRALVEKGVLRPRGRGKGSFFELAL